MIDKAILVDLGLNAPNLISGALGGAVSAFIATTVSPTSVFISIFVGACCANYATDYISSMSGLPPGLAGLTIGACALAAVPLIKSIVTKKLTAMGGA